MPERPEFIQLDTSDDVPSVRDRLSFIHGKRVLLIWPEQGTVLTRKLDLVLVQREAMRRAVRLALVTHDAQVIKNAEELNISAFETIGASERARWKRGRAKVFASRYQRPPDLPASGDVIPAAAQQRTVESEPRPSLWRVLWRVAALALLLVAVGTAAYVALPGAVVTLYPAQERITAESVLTASPTAADVDIEAGLVPAMRLSITVDESGTLPTTGTLPLAAVSAQGTAIFVNQTPGGVDIPVGTTVSTSAGVPVLFRTTAAARVPAGSGQQMEVPIQALQASAGEIGNVDAGLINTIVGDLANQLTVRNLTPTYGGTSRSAAVVSAQDQERLLAIVRQQLQSRAYVEMLPRLNDGQTLILETVRIAEERADWTVFSADVGQAADSLTLDMRAVVEAVAVNQRLGQQVVLAQLSRQIPRGQQLQPESVSYEIGAVTQVFQDGTVQFSVTGSGLVAAQPDTALVQERLAGRPLDEALAYLQTDFDLDPARPPVIDLIPSWLGQMPLLPVRITVRVENDA
jgi:hypothetical protein